MDRDDDYGGVQQPPGVYPGTAAGLAGTSNNYGGSQNPPSPHAGKNARASAYAEELAAARETLYKSARTANNFKTSIGAVAGRGRLVPTIRSNIYWFAKLYELITHFEIESAATLKHPGFLLHFIPVFYDMYFNALEGFLNKKPGGVSALWRAHFASSSGRPDMSGIMGWTRDIALSIQTGATAHIQGDMDKALVRSYQSYVAKYSLTGITLDTFKDDFLIRNRPVFVKVQAEFFLEISNLSTFPGRPEVGQYIIGVGQRSGVGGGLDLDEVFQWRELAWESAKRILGQ